MQSWCFKEGFGLENLIRAPMAMSACGPDDVVLQMRAASMNYRDLVVMRGQHGRAVTPPLVPLSDGVGVVVAIGDQVKDFAGADTLNTSVKAVKTGGTILLIGNISGNLAEISLPLILTRRITMHSVSCGSKESFQSLCKLLEQHKIKPIIGKIFAFHEAPSAFEALESGQVFGKICVSCSEEEQL